MNQQAFTTMAMAVCLATTACGPSPAVGDWESKDRIQSDRNELELEEDGRGQSTLYFFYGEDFYEVDFDVDWEEESNGDLTLEYTCDGNCSELDFGMDCTLSSDEEEMECDAEEPFRGYEFEWVRQ